MKKLSAIIIILFSLNVNAQYFDGVKIEGAFNSVIEKYKTKGYRLVEKNNDYCQMSGNLNSENIELWLYCSPKSKIATKAVIFFTQKNTWRDLKGQYNIYKGIFTEKYGEPKVYEYFSTPYEEGDGYEVQAIGLEKCTYMSFWLDYNNTNMMVSISKYKQVQVSYENITAVEISKRESNELNSQKF